jgi:leucyl aminopeptidase
MAIQIETTTPAEISADWLVLPVFEAAATAGPLVELDAALGGLLTRLRESGDLNGQLAETVVIPDTPGIQTKRILVAGLGKSGQLSPARLEKTMMTAVRKISEKENCTVAFLLPDVSATEMSAEEVTCISATAMTVGSVGQGLYQTKSGRFPITSTLLVDSTETQQALTASVLKGEILGESINQTRDLVNRMADEIYPVSFAKRAEEMAAEVGLTCRVLDEEEMKADGMGSLLAVAIGSDRPPRLVVLEHQGADESAPVLGLVGKGVTFDSGGLSLKPTDGMKTMKCDMAGAATVFGAMAAIAKLKLPVNVKGYMGLVENMVSGSSYKLGDVLKARNGVTIEVLNTDAEGRLVLADVLNYAVSEKVDRLVDLATLTGACVVALGEEVTGVFSNNQQWQDTVLDSAKTSGEDAWQMPMFEQFGDLLKSDVADCKNVGPRWGGAITAAKFLEKFVEGKPWVHLDIAGPSFASSNKSDREGGATGCMVRTLVEIAGRG